MPDSAPICLEISGDDQRRFQADGFLIKPGVLSPAFVESLGDRFPKLFAGDFDTGVYPDEWYWRENLSRPDVTRHLANAWKSDLTVARLVLSEILAAGTAQLTGWPAVRLGQDTIWWKPPQTRSITYHQDTSFMDFLDPAQTLTCWVALDETHRDAGTLEYIPGSHRWPLAPIPQEFHAADDYRATVRHAAAQGGIPADSMPAPVYVEAPAGSVAFHAGETWHGSGPNRTENRMRRSIGIHFLPAHARFSSRKGGYIYRRYQIIGDPTLHESFFPLLWSSTGARSAWLAAYLERAVE